MVKRHENCFVDTADTSVFGKMVSANERGYNYILTIGEEEYESKSVRVMRKKKCLGVYSPFMALVVMQDKM